MTRLHLITAMGMLGLATTASAQSWAPANPRLAKAGIVAQRIVSFEGNTAGALVRCIPGQLEFVLIDASGETHDGPSTLRAGGKSFPVQFSKDPSLRAAIGDPGSWASVPREALEAMGRGKEVVLDNRVKDNTGQTYVSTVKIPLTGFAGLWKKISGVCGGGAAAGTPPVAAAAPAPAGLPPAVAKARDSYVSECRSMGGKGGGFRPGGILTADFNADGVTDYVLDLNKFDCPGGPAGAGYCGSDGCSVDAFVSQQGGSYKQDGWMGMYGASIQKTGVSPALKLDGRRGAVLLKWSGKSFVRG